MTIPVPERERERIEALRRYEILDTPPEENFDRITRIIAAYLNVPIALVSLVDETRQWFKSRYGLDAEETPRQVAFCAHAIMGDTPMVVGNATRDPRFANNPLVTGQPDIRFYCGAPLRTRDGFNLGTLCAIDQRPRRVTKEQQRVLTDLARIVVDELELRLAGRKALKEVEMRHRSEKALTEANLRMETIFDSVIDGIIVVDGNGRIDAINASAERLFDYDPSELVGQKVDRLLPDWSAPGGDASSPGDPDKAADPMVKNHGRLDGRRKDGSVFPAELAVNTMDLADSRSFVAIARDISERKQIERMKNEFISTVSHELRTPLTSIKGSLGLIQSSVLGDLPKEVRSMVEIACNNSERLLRLINDILDMEKIEAGRMEFRMQPVEVMPLIRQVIASNTGYGDQFGVTFVVTESTEDAWVEGDIDRLNQVLTNLLANATKVSCRNSRVEIAVSSDGADYCIAVKDYGPGIPEAFRGKIFEKFSQADSSDTRRIGGSGLGLSICKAIIERHRGTIGFDTESGVGSRFYFRIPASRESSRHSPSKAA